jgi:signal transduction histidine kinase
VRPGWRSLRVRLAVLGFLVAYLPVLLLFAVTSLTEDEREDTVDGTVMSDSSSASPSPWVTVTAVALAPAAAGLAWWWAGRAVRPIDHVRRVAEEIEATDLGRRIDLGEGPAEIVALAASFDAMLDRLEHAAATQRRLVEETSHELRTPLAVLETNADVVLSRPEPSVADLRDGIERSKAAAVRMRTTIDALLVDARGRARTIDRRPSDLRRVVDAVVDGARVLAASRRVALSVTGPAVAPCPIDEATVTRAVSNLVDNAIRHAPEGSTVDVEVEVGVASELATVAVSDHGAGIPPDEQDRIFERFWRGQLAPGAAGLGLPIAREVARAHGGSLTVRSPGPAGDGCRFELTVRSR